MSVELGTLRPGHWRDLTKDEMAEINAAVATSTKTAQQTDDTLPILHQEPEHQKLTIDTSSLNFNHGKKSHSLVKDKKSIKLSLNKK